MLKYDQHLFAQRLQFIILLGEHQHNLNQHVDKKASHLPPYKFVQ